MAMYRVSYSSMTAHYGPSFIEADDEYAARRRFAQGAFSENEMGCISAREVTPQEIQRALAHRNQEEAE